MGAPTDLAAFGLARRAGERGAGQHRVLGGDPSAAGVAHPAGHAGFDRGIAKDTRIAGFDEDRALSGGNKADSEADRPQRIGSATVGPEDLGGSGKVTGGGYVQSHAAIIVVQAGVPAPKPLSS